MVPLPTPPGPDDDDDEHDAVGGACQRERGHGLTCRADRATPASAVAPRPWTRRLSAMPMSSMILRALTLPTPGSDSSSETTLSLPTVESVEAQCLGERDRAELELVLQLGASGAGLGGLGQRGGPLFGRQLGRCCHVATLAVSCTPACVAPGCQSSGPGPAPGDGPIGQLGQPMMPSRPLAHVEHLATMRIGGARIGERRRCRPAPPMAPASISSTASHPVATPPTPTIGRSGSAACTSKTVAHRDRMDRAPDSPAAAGAERRPQRRLDR